MKFFWIGIAVLGGGLLLLLVNDTGGSTLGLSNDDFANMLYLGLFGMLVASALFTRPIRFGEFTRNLVLFLLLLVGLVAGYQFRYELQDVASRVSAGLVPGSPLAVGEENGRATITLQKMANNHFGATISVGGTAVHAVVDTGASSTVLTYDDAERAGLEPGKLSFTIPVSTANGTGRAALARPADIALGPIARNNQRVMVAERGALQQSLLGMNFIGTLSIDMRGDRMILRD